MNGNVQINILEEYEMKTFFMSYWTEVLKPNYNWAKKHWIGMIIFALICYAVLIIYEGTKIIAFNINEIKNSKELKRHF